MNRIASAIILNSVVLGCLPALADGKANLPLCHEQRVVNAAVEAIEDAFYRVGLGPLDYGAAVHFVKQGLKPSWLPDTANVERAAARGIGYGPEHIRLCLAPIDESSRITVMIATNPQDHDMWVVGVSNIGLGNTMAESLPKPK